MLTRSAVKSLVMVTAPPLELPLEELLPPEDELLEELLVVPPELLEELELLLEEELPPEEDELGPIGPPELPPPPPQAERPTAKTKHSMKRVQMLIDVSVITYRKDRKPLERGPDPKMGNPIQFIS